VVVPSIGGGETPAPEVVIETPSSDPAPVSTPAPEANDDAAPEPDKAASVGWDEDWRKHLAGDDDSALTELARIKTPQDLVKQLANQKKELSKRAVSGQFPADADEATQQSWRDHNGVPKEGTLKAYEVKPPEGYELSEVESGMVNDFVKEMHGANAPKEYVQTALDQWFRMNAANEQQTRTLDEDRHNEWAQEIRTELGKDYEPIVEASNTFIEQLIPDEATRGELLNARLAGGGILAHNPGFIRMIGDLALQNGFGDRIEANSMESGGKSLAEQHRELSDLQHTDPQRYDMPATQEKLDKIIAHRLSRGEIDADGNEIRRR